MDEKLYNLFKAEVGTRIKDMRGKESRDSYSSKLNKKSDALRSAENGVNAATLELILAVSEHEGVPPDTLLPSYVMSRGPTERDEELDKLKKATGPLSHYDIQTLRLMAEALANRPPAKND